MHTVGAFVSAIADAMIPDGTMARVRVRTTFDVVATLVVALLAVVLTVGYQVFGRWARRQHRED